MARTVAGTREVPLTSRPAYQDRTAACGFCIDLTPSGVRHDLCPGQTHTNPGRRDDKVWTCNCWKEGHPE